MPIYEYTCTDCSLDFELLRPFSQADEKAECPRCRKPAGRKLSTFACFSKGDSGEATRISGTGNSCSSCGASSCSTCGL